MDSPFFVLMSRGKGLIVPWQLDAMCFFFAHASSCRSNCPKCRKALSENGPSIHWSIIILFFPCKLPFLVYHMYIYICIHIYIYIYIHIAFSGCLQGSPSPSHLQACRSGSLACPSWKMPTWQEPKRPGAAQICRPSCPSVDSQGHNCTLILTEGDSAKVPVLWMNILMRNGQRIMLTTSVSGVLFAGYLQNPRTWAKSWVMIDSSILLARYPSFDPSSCPFYLQIFSSFVSSWQIHQQWFDDKISARNLHL